MAAETGSGNACSLIAMAELTGAPFGNSKRAVDLDPGNQALRTQLWKVEGAQAASAESHLEVTSSPESSTDTTADEMAVPLTDYR